MRARLNSDGGLHPAGINADPHFGALNIVAFASASNPTDEVVDNTAGSVVAGASFGCTLDADAGTITMQRPGLYLVSLDLGQVSSASASGNIQFDVQKNSSALSPVLRTKILEPAVVNNFMNMSCSRPLSLAKNDVLRVVVTGTVGGIITVANGTFWVLQLSDAALSVTV
jgi:hypothetical protein